MSDLIFTQATPCQFNSSHWPRDKTKTKKKCYLHSAKTKNCMCSFLFFVKICQNIRQFSFKILYTNSINCMKSCCFFWKAFIPSSGSKFYEHFQKTAAICIKKLRSRNLESEIGPWILIMLHTRIQFHTASLF